MRRLAAFVLSFALLLVGLVPAALAHPREAEEQRADLEQAEASRLGANGAATLLGGGHGGGGNGRCALPTPPAEENVDLPPGLIPYHEVAPRLCAIDAGSDRVSLEVFGESAGGRDLYLATLADPRSGSLRDDLAFRRLLAHDPDAARRLAQRNPRLRNVIWVNGSIHGNEWEGVDASIALIERLATAGDEETRALLRENVFLFNVVQNPDGRVQGTRQNANGIDLNRDFATRSQSENRAVVAQFARWFPTGVYDLHGYVSPMLIEPTTAPHNPNYEYDLYLRWALPAALEAQEQLLADTGLESDIPFLEYQRGDWDDWPPIFTPQLAQYYGAVSSSTLEVPLDQNGAAADDPPEERRERGEINTAAHVAVVWGSVRHLTENAQAVMLDQIEILDRGDEGVPPASDALLDPPGQDAGYPDLPGYDADPPEAYLLPVGEDGDVAPDTARLVNHLRAYGIEIERAWRPFRADGTRYERGTFVIPMQQPLRGLANSLLERGYDLTPVTPQMYDISGWSLSELWGAPVVATEDDVPSGFRLRRDVDADADVPRNAGAYALTVDDPSDIRAVNALLADGVAMQRAPDGRVIAPSSARRALERAGREEGLEVEGLRAVPPGSTPLTAPRIAASIYTYEGVLLRDLGFDVTDVEDFSTLTAADYDVLAFSTGPAFADLSAEEQAAVQAFLAAGGGLVAWTSEGADFNVATGALAANYDRYDGATPNGVAEVDNDPASPIVSGYPQEDTTFVYDPLWFTELGAGVRADQRYGEGDFFVSGHWIEQEAAAGEPSIVSGDTAGGGRGVLIGTDPLFRNHPKGLFGQMAQALYWAGGG